MDCSRRYRKASAMSNASEKIDRAQTKMLLAYPWWASLYLQARRQETKTIPTMAVDGTYLYYNPAFVDSLSPNELLAVLMHETAHLALLHCYRRQWRDPMLWNIACDAAVNALLLAEGLTLPKGCVPPEKLGLTAEEIYDKLEKNATKISIPQDVLAPGEGP